MSETVLSDGRPRNPEVQAEPRDVSPRGILIFVGALTAVAVVVHLGIWWLFDYYQDREAREKQSPFPLAAGERGRLPPPPRLEGIQQRQGGTRPDHADERSGAAAELNEFRWVDRTAGVVAIPLDTAMQLVVEQNRPPTGKEIGRKAP